MQADLAAASNPATSPYALSSLVHSPSARVRVALTQNPKLSQYNLRRLATDHCEEVSIAACLVIARGTTHSIAAALNGDPDLARALLRAGQARNDQLHQYVMPPADFERVLVALKVRKAGDELADIPRDWVAVIAEALID